MTIEIGTPEAQAIIAADRELRKYECRDCHGADYQWLVCDDCYGFGVAPSWPFEGEEDDDEEECPTCGGEKGCWACPSCEAEYYGSTKGWDMSRKYKLHSSAVQQPAAARVEA